MGNVATTKDHHDGQRIIVKVHKRKKKTRKTKTKKGEQEVTPECEASKAWSAQHRLRRHPIVAILGIY